MRVLSLLLLIIDPVPPARAFPMRMRFATRSGRWPRLRGEAAATLTGASPTTSPAGDGELDHPKGSSACCARLFGGQAIGVSIGRIDVELDGDRATACAPMTVTDDSAAGCLLIVRPDDVTTEFGAGKSGTGPATTQDNGQTTRVSAAPSSAAAGRSGQEPSEFALETRLRSKLRDAPRSRSVASRRAPSETVAENPVVPAVHVSGDPNPPYGVRPPLPISHGGLASG